MSLFITVLFAVFFASSADAAPVAWVIAAASGAYGIGVAIVTRIGLAIASSALTRMFSRLQNNTAQPGIRTQGTTAGDTTSQSFIIGKYATDGNLAAPEMTHGTAGDTPNAYLTLVIDLGDIPISSFEGAIVDGREVSFNGDVHAEYGVAASGYFAGKLWAKFYDGSQTVADPMLLSKYGTAEERPWTSNMIGRGVPYVIYTCLFDREIFQSKPKIRNIVKGIKLYDVRKDGSVGGSGSHRWGNLSTYEFTENPIVMTYNLLRGIELPDGRTYGGGYAHAELPITVWAAAMNKCDQGFMGSNYFSAGYEVRISEDSPLDVIDAVNAAAAADLADLGGVMHIRAGGPGLPVAFITDGDILRTKAQDLDPFPSLKDTHNGIRASYPSPSLLWEARDAPMRSNATALAEDGEELIADINLPAVTRGHQVQRLMHGWLKDERRFRRHNIILPPDGLLISPLDTISWTSSRNGYVSKLFEVNLTGISPRSLSTTLSIREVDPTDFDFAEADILPTVVPSIAPIVIPAQPLPGFNVQGVQIADATGTPRRPGIKLTWSGSLPDVQAVKYVLRVKATGSVVSSGSTHDVESGEWVISDGLLPNVEYEAKAKPVTKRKTVWTSWLSTTTPNIKLGAADIADGAISAAQLSAAIKADISSAVADAASAVTTAQAISDEVDAATATAIAAAEQAVTDAEVARDATIAAGNTAITTANQAATIALSSKEVAQSEASKALASANSALASKDAAITAQTSASGSATSAASSASVATTKATEAGQSATSANTAKLDAQTAKSAAQSSQTSAATSATNAAGSASTATTQATNSANSATAAGSSASAATTSAATATTKATEANQSATTANTERVAAQTARSASEAARDIAVTSKNSAQSAESSAASSASLAANSATSAGSSATSAATSATTATTKATEANQSSTAANTAKVDAQTARSGAQAAETAAATSATTATGAASTAATNRAVTARVVGNLLPYDFRESSMFWSDNISGEPSLKPDMVDVTFVDVAGEGRVLNASGAISGYRQITPKGSIPNVVGRTYRLTVRARILGSLSTSAVFSLARRRFDSSYSNTDSAFETKTFTALDVWQTFTMEYTVTNDSAAYLILHARVYFPTTDASTTIQVSQSLVEDITDSKAAAGSAAASAQSLSSAQAVKTAIDVTAAAVSADRLAATTAKSASEAARDLSVSSKTAAEAAQAAALQSATLAANSQSNAGTSATSAATSATTAATKASEAATSAATSNSQRILAETAQAAASVSKTSAATSATNAAGSAATATEKANLTVNATNGLTAQVNTVASAISTINGKLAATYSFKASAGGALSLLELVASDDPTGTPKSIAKLSADNIILDGTVNVTKLSVGSGHNLLKDPTFTQGLTYCRSVGSGTVDGQCALSLTPAGSNYANPRNPTLRLLQSGTSQDGEGRIYFQDIDKNGDRDYRTTSVVAGKWYMFSALVAHGFCDGAIGIFWRDKDGVYLSASKATIANVADSTNPKEWTRSRILAQAPAGATYCTPIVFKNGTESGQSWSDLRVDEPQFEESHAAATGPRSFGYGGGALITGDGIVAKSITAASGAIADLAVGTLQIAGNAVYSGVTASNDTPQTVSTNTWTSLLSATIVRTSGNQTMFQFTVEINNVTSAFSSDRLLEFRIKRGSTVIKTFSFEQIGKETTVGFTKWPIDIRTVSHFDPDTSGGTSTYSLEYRVNVGGGVNACILGCQQFKKTGV